MWQWLHNDIELHDGQRVTRELVERLIEEEMAKIGEHADTSGGHWAEARDTFTEISLADDYVDFLTLPAYERMP